MFTGEREWADHMADGGYARPDEAAPRLQARAWFAEGGTGPSFGVLQFQCGGIPEFGRNGVTIEEVTQVLLARLHELNDKFPCDENEQAIYHFNHALFQLDLRTARRKAQGVEGKEVPHASS